MGRGGRGVAQKREQQPEAMLRRCGHVQDRSRAIAQADDPHGGGACCIEVDMIEAGGGGEDVSKLWRSGDDRTPDMRPKTDHDHVAIDKFARKRAIVERPVADAAEIGQGLLCPLSQMQGLGHDDFHDPGSLPARPLSIRALAIRKSPGTSMLIERSHGIS